MNGINEFNEELYLDLETMRIDFEQDAELRGVLESEGFVAFETEVEIESTFEDLPF